MVRFEKDFSLQAYNSFGLEANVRYYFEFTEEADLPAFLCRFDHWERLPILFLGGGSNLLFRGDFDGLVLHVTVPGIEVLREDDQHVWIEAGAGENWDNFVSWCVHSGYCGVENLSLIPGNVGAAPVQNIGAYGVEARESVSSVKGFDLKTFDFLEIPAESCEFGYRDSIFKRQFKDRFIVTSVVFKLNKFPVFKLNYGDLSEEVERTGGPELSHVRNAVIAIRRRKLPDPELVGNAGSFFKNPVVSQDRAVALKAAFPGLPVYQATEGSVKLAAGWLIEQCGWKGFRVGDAGVHEKQALVLVNFGKATGEQLLDLSERIRESVWNRFSVRLEPEVLII